MSNDTKKISVSFRMDPEKAEQLKELCDINQRSQRELIEIFIEKYYNAWLANPKMRINP